MNFFKLLISFDGRLDRPNFLGFGLVCMVASFVLFAFDARTAAQFMVIFLLYILNALIYAGASVRRLRDAGLTDGWLAASAIVATILLPVSWLVLLLPGRWDAQGGLHHVLMMIKHIARAGHDRPGVTQESADAFDELMTDLFGFPDSLRKRILREFASPAAPTMTAVQHAHAFRMTPDTTPDMLSELTVAFTVIANAAEGRDEAKLSVIDDIADAFQVKPPLPPGVAETVALAAKIARADGRVSQEEIDALDGFLRYGLGLTNRMRTEAVGIFRKAKDDSQSYTRYADAGAQSLSSDLARELSFRVLLDIALADGELHDREVEILDYVARVFGISHDFGSTAGQGSSGKKGNAGGGSGPGDDDAGAGRKKKSGGQDRQRQEAPRGHRDDAYYAKVLGIDPDADSAEIKRAWRDLIAKNHPDKVKTMSEAIQQFAHDQTVQINEAYDHFKRQGRA